MREDRVPSQHWGMYIMTLHMDFGLDAVVLLERCSCMVRKVRGDGGRTTAELQR